MQDQIVTLLTTIDHKLGRILEGINPSVGIDADYPRPTGTKGTSGTSMEFVDTPNPSCPLSKKDAAALWGGSMNQPKLTRLMKAGKIRHREINRQLFIFSRDDIPNLPPAK